MCISLREWAWVRKALDSVRFFMVRGDTGLMKV